MITITRNGLKLTCDSDIIPAQGSSNVPVSFVNDDDEYASYIVQPSIGWYTKSGAFKATLAVFENNSFDIPAEAFLQDGQIYISIGLVDPQDANHIEKTLQLSLRCTPAPFGTVILPSEDQWTKVVEDDMRELFNNDYKAQFDEIESDLNDLIDEAQTQQTTVNGLITSVDGLITQTNETIEEAETAITNTNSATQAANTATSQANSARDQANSAAQSANSIAQQVQQKLENGDFVPNLTIGEVTTLEAGEDATASITGTSEDPVLNLGIPKGPQGPKGNDGNVTLPIVVENATDILKLSVSSETANLISMPELGLLKIGDNNIVTCFEGQWQRYDGSLMFLSTGGIRTADTTTYDFHSKTITDESVPIINYIKPQSSQSGLPSSIISHVSDTTYGSKLEFGNTDEWLDFKGVGTRPKYNGNELALKSDASVVTSHNLLINGDFLINTRGETTYTEKGYTLPMWYLYVGSYVTSGVSLEVLDDGSIKLQNDSNDGSRISFAQKIDNYYKGKTVTIVGKFKNVINNGHSINGVKLSILSGNKMGSLFSNVANSTVNINSDGEFRKTVTINSTHSTMAVGVSVDKYWSCEIDYIVMYEGDAIYEHLSEDKATALARCDKYLLKLSRSYAGYTSASSDIYIACDKLMDMASTPTFSYNSVDDGTGAGDINVRYNGTTYTFPISGGRVNYEAGEIGILLSKPSTDIALRTVAGWMVNHIYLSCEPQ